MKAAVREPKPSWLKVRPPSGANYERIKGLMSAQGLHSVCEEARCPNIAECWGGGTATFMVMGEKCSRGCRFCSVESALKLPLLDAEEPAKLAESLSALGLEYAVVTTVCRDDLPDQGAAHLAACIREVKRRCPRLLLEVLLQDFRGERALLELVSDAGADVLAHNLETVQRLTASVRDARAGYAQSLDVLRTLKALKPERHTKSSLMLGLGETEDELLRAFEDLREAGVTILTLGQYLRPSGAGRNLPVFEYLEPARFEAYRERAESMGFLYVASGPFVRSSYRAGELFLQGMLRPGGRHDRNSR
jgi:lipoyl synthase